MVALASVALRLPTFFHCTVTGTQSPTLKKVNEFDAGASNSTLPGRATAGPDASAATTRNFARPWVIWALTVTGPWTTGGVILSPGTSVQLFVSVCCPPVETYSLRAYRPVPNETALAFMRPRARTHIRLCVSIFHTSPAPLAAR